MDVDVLQRFFQHAQICLPCLSQYLDLTVRQTFPSQVTEEELKTLLIKNMEKFWQNPRLAPQFSSLEDKESTLQSLVQALMTKSFPTHACTNCLNLFVTSNIDHLIHSIEEKLISLSTNNRTSPSTSNQFQEIQVEFNLPPILDASRIATRTMVTYSADKTIMFSAFDIILMEILTLRLKERGISIVTNAKVIVQIDYCIFNQIELCMIMNPEFRNKRVKRKYGVPNHNNTLPEQGGATTDGVQTTGDDVLRHNIDALILWMKSLTKQGVDKMYAKSIEFLQQQSTQNLHNHYKVSVYYAPIYIFGRYCKFARDVPQSPWSVSEDAPTGSHDGSHDQESSTGDGQPSTGNHSATETVFVAKGRNSVEEIIAHEIKQASQAGICKLHACGREDIDVRCLGNGRPFALEVIQARLDLTQEVLNQIVCNINGRKGLNTMKDIIIKGPMMTCDRGIWENMQSEAEEKKKGYRCVIYVKNGLQQSGIKLLEEMCNRSRNGDELDDEGVSCLKITQRTPLRVMHRRSLMDRIRYIYDLDVCILNEKFFILSLVTSAGAYVKEFVHGDLGRTRPSIASIVHSPSEILQLDVIRLFDDFEKYSLLPKDMISLMSAEMKQQLQQDAEEEQALETSWQYLKTMKQPVYKITK